MTRRRKTLLGLVALLAGLAGGLWAVGRPALQAKVAVHAAPDEALPPQPAMAVVDPSPSPSAQRFAFSTITEPPAEAPPLPRNLAAATAEDYRDRARFPPSSHPITDGVDPVERDREVTRGRSLGPEGQDPTLFAYPARATFEAPQPVTLYAHLERHGRRVDAHWIQGIVRTEDAVVLAGLDFRDDGKGGDQVAGDLLFTAVLAPPPAATKRLKGAQLVEVRAETLAQGERIAVTGFLYSVPSAHLTGRYRDAVVDGHLDVSAEVRVHEAGRFHLEATLADAAGEPLGWAQAAVVLDEGLAWITLRYWGLIFYQRGVGGPFVLRSVALSTTGEMPNQKNDVAELAHVTRPYDLAAFSSLPFDDPDLLEAAGRLEAEAPLAGGLEAAVH